MKIPALDRGALSPLINKDRPQAPPDKASGLAFGDVLEGSINKVNHLQKTADQAVQDLTTGKEQDIHRTMIALEKASVSLELMLQVRNKIIAAYEEIKRMQI
jgi:flagellar hook-basal body complex protein FliE